ncbi:hypothetical protein [Chitinophaga filiformis]|uniref:Apea-like HEPN domain-containing protein n=1 Tax=Chitinophaga filiformis TaxID=104663 RepID=A0A1G7RE82_CHIFI|nr:hypothetical protein [Chitinophaga filiformis]SDG08944.1 hypothetical protein SAMN04488121_103427 [Chitinophaga filiformis]
MQKINHKNSTLSICQRFFIEKSIELLFLGSMDSYRVKLNNPKTILKELKYCLQEYETGRIKHFHTLKAKEKDKKAAVDEAISLLSSDNPNYLVFKSISQKYLEQSLRTIDEFNYRKVISSIEILLSENEQYLRTVINELDSLLAINNSSIATLEKLDHTLNILFSELINNGFSKGFLYKLVYGTFVKSLGPESVFNDHFQSFKTRISDSEVEHTVIFRVDTTYKVYDAISTISISDPKLSLSDNINNIQLDGMSKKEELASFNATGNTRKFIHCKVKTTDYLAALKTARSVLSEYLDVINLGLSDEFLEIHNRVLVIDSRSPQSGDFQHHVNILDGKYRVTKDRYWEFTTKLPAILNDPLIANETKQKIKSAIRYLRLGNQSIEVEHKFINYWIGLEYLFSNYESQHTINRIKEHFINAHCLAYVKRNVHHLKKNFARLDNTLVPAYHSPDDSFLKEESFYNEFSKLLPKFPLLAYRGMKLKQWFFKKGKTGNAKDYIRAHKEHLEIHFTRIYRLRNEIIHDAATNTNNEQITSNLRYYLTFILNELIDCLSKPTTERKSIEDYFILNEIRLGNIEQNGYLLEDLLNVDCSLEFISS